MPAAHRVPRALRQGDEVAIVAPAGPVDQGRLAQGVARLRTWGLEVTVMPHVVDSGPLGYLAGHDQDRASDLQAALQSPSVRAVICARGGYGSSRVIDLVDWPTLASAEPTWLVGSSDITALHEAVAHHLGMASILGPMAASEMFTAATPDDASVVALRNLLFGESGPVLLTADGPVMTPGTATGVLRGGNLTMLASSIGTPESVNADGAIVVLEDVSESPYRIDRLLTQLRRSGWFDGVRGVALGSFIDCGDVQPVLRDRLSDLDVPVVAGFGIGHGPIQLSVLLGLNVQLDAVAGSLVCGVST